MTKKFRETNKEIIQTENISFSSKFLGLFNRDIALASLYGHMRKYTDQTTSRSHIGFSLFLEPNDDRYHYVPISHVKRRVLEDIKLRSSEFLNEHLIKKFNSLYNKTWTPRCK